MANTKITTNVIADGAITSAKLDTSGLAIPSTATATTQSAGDNSTKVATTAYVETAVSNLVSAAPAALDTLDELAAALGDDANFATTVTDSLALKAPLASPNFTGDVTFDTSTLVVDSTNNRVGIGTASPNTKLDISGNVALNAATVNPWRSSQTVIQLNEVSSLSNYGSLVTALDHNSYIDSGNNRRYIVTGQEAYTLTLNSYDNGLIFSTASAGTAGDIVSLTEKFRITTGGNVGIGTDNPSSRLEVEDDSSNTTGASGAFIDINNTNGATGASSGIRFLNGATASYKGAIFFKDSAGDGRGDLIFATNNVASGGDEVDFDNARMTILAGGNVGIGNPDPTAKLEVGDGSSTYIKLRNASTGDISSGYNIESGSTTTTSLYGNASEGWTTLLSGGSLHFRVNNAVSGFNPLNITTSGNVGIGTASPDEKLHVHASDSGNSYAAFTNATTGLTTEFLVGLNAAEDALVYNENNSNMIFATNNLERMRILSGGGLTFNGDTAAANALDDYEEGTWTPKYNSVTNFSAAHGHYQKIGNRVFFSFYIQMFSSSNGNRFQCVGLPFNTTDFSTNPEDDANRGFMTIGYTTYGSAFTVLLDSPSTDTFAAYTYGGAGITLAQLSGKAIYGAGSYITSS